MSKHEDSLVKLKNYDNHYQTYTDKLSTTTRQLAFAEGGIFWMLNGNGLIDISYIGLFFLVMFFICDVLQYYIGMKNYEALGDHSREMLDESNYSHTTIQSGNANKKIEWAFKWKIIFIFIASIWLIFGFLIKICC